MSNRNRRWGRRPEPGEEMAHRKPSYVKIIDTCVDIPSCTTLEITYNKHPDGTRLWVHCDGVLVGRFYRIKDLYIDDLAKRKDR